MALAVCFSKGDTKPDGTVADGDDFIASPALLEATARIEADHRALLDLMKPAHWPPLLTSGGFVPLQPPPLDAGAVRQIVREEIRAYFEGPDRGHRITEPSRIGFNRDGEEG